jgi:hypothetical protein
MRNRVGQHDNLNELRPYLRRVARAYLPFWILAGLAGDFVLIWIKRDVAAIVASVFFWALWIPLGIGGATRLRRLAGPDE